MTKTVYEKKIMTKKSKCTPF